MHDAETDRVRFHRLSAVAALAIAGLVIALATSGVLTWVIVDPHYWLPGAFAQRGEQGPRGPRGMQGPPGPPGPVGPDAADVISDLEFQLSDLEGRLDDLETGTGDQAAESVDDISFRVDDLENKMDDLESTVAAICDAFAAFPAFQEIYGYAC